MFVPLSLKSQTLSWFPQARTKDLDQIQLIDLDPKVHSSFVVLACDADYANYQAEWE